MTNAEKALEMIAPDTVVGLGTGRAAVAFVRALGAKVQAGLKIRGIPTSESTAQLARELGIPLVSLEEVEEIDVDFDGADEVDPKLNLVKGLGGALLREKIIAAASKRLVILVGAEKLSPALGTRGVLPVEVVPFGLPLCRRRLAKLGYPAMPRQKGGQLYVTDNGNYILDCKITATPDPSRVERDICAIPGVVDTGLFLGMADVVLIQDGDRVDIRRR
jgi:ribose 5-phosphate isomerase A